MENNSAVETGEGGIIIVLRSDYNRYMYTHTCTIKYASFLSVPFRSFVERERKKEDFFPLLPYSFFTRFRDVDRIVIFIWMMISNLECQWMRNIFWPTFLSFMEATSLVYINRGILRFECQLSEMIMLRTWMTSRVKGKLAVSCFMIRRLFLPHKKLLR